MLMPHKITALILNDDDGSTFRVLPLVASTYFSFRWHLTYYSASTSKGGQRTRRNFYFLSHIGPLSYSSTWLLCADNWNRMRKCEFKEIETNWHKHVLGDVPEQIDMVQFCVYDEAKRFWFRWQRIYRQLERRLRLQPSTYLETTHQGPFCTFIYVRLLWYKVMVAATLAIDLNTTHFLYNWKESSCPSVYIQ